jgi:hypothetical protein
LSLRQQCIDGVDGDGGESDRGAGHGVILPSAGAVVCYTQEPSSPFAHRRVQSAAERACGLRRCPCRPLPPLVPTGAVSAPPTARSSHPALRASSIARTLGTPNRPRGASAPGNVEKAML